MRHCLLLVNIFIIVVLELGTYFTLVDKPKFVELVV
jgi:hypothetical protein